MTEEEALALVEDGLVSERSLSVRLRMGEGLDRVMLERTKEALRFLAHLYRDRDTIPKRLAFATVDLTGLLTSGEHSDDLWYEVQKAGDELTSLAYSIFEPGPRLG
jgi:hypothetical protein